MMKQEIYVLERIILSFKDWSRPWLFYEYIAKNEQLNEQQILTFKEIWAKASRFELWNYRDIELGCEKSSKFIQDNFCLSNEAINYIVKALSYEWR